MGGAAAIERAALTDFQRLTAASGPDGGRTRLLEVAGAICTVLPTEPDSLLGNRVVGLGVAEPPTDHDLETIEGFYAAHGAGFVVAGDVPGLAARGYRPAEPWTRLVRGAEPAPEATTVYAVDAVQAGDAAAFGAACTLASSAPPSFAAWAAALVVRPGWHCFAARDGEAIVATAALYAAAGGGWLGFAATDPQHRCRGAQSALLAARIDRGRELGLDVLVSSAAAPAGAPVSQSQRNMLRAGFRVDGALVHWRSPRRGT